MSYDVLHYVPGTSCHKNESFGRACNEVRCTRRCTRRNATSLMIDVSCAVLYISVSKIKPIFSTTTENRQKTLGWKFCVLRTYTPYKATAAQANGKLMQPVCPSHLYSKQSSWYFSEYSMRAAIAHVNCCVERGKIEKPHEHNSTAVPTRNWRIGEATGEFW